ncbi:MAG TPA: PaaI family thioesterase [Burkholderiales bacterium]
MAGTKRRSGAASTPRTAVKKAGTGRGSVTRSRRKPPVSPVLDAGLPRLLGIRLLTLTKKKITAEMPIKPMHLNRTGRVAGGAIMSFADVLGAVGAVLHRPQGYRGGTIESKSNFFAAGKGPALCAVTVPLHIGRTTSVWQTTVKNKDGALVAVVTQTQIALPHAKEGGQS